MSNDDVLRRVFDMLKARGLSEAGAQLVAGKGWAESFLGVRGAKGATSGTSQFLTPEGAPSFNVGAVTAREGQAFFYGGDHDAAGKPITQKWARFASMDEGLDNYLTRADVRTAWEAINAGDAVTFAAILYDRGYYSGSPPPGKTAAEWTRDDRIRAYAQMTKGAASRVAAATGRPLLVRADGAVPASTKSSGGGGGGGAKPPAPKPTPHAADDGGGGLLALGLVTTLVIALVKVF